MFDSIQLIDGLHMYQDFDFDLPYLGDIRQFTVDVQTGDVIHDSQPSFTFEGSHTTSILIRISGRRVTISRGNPSKINRSDGNPEFTSAGTNAVGPGRDSTSILFSMQALTIRNPGSEIPGVPASVINAIDIPDSNL